jgi:hypothetical protein
VTVASIENRPRTELLGEGERWVTQLVGEPLLRASFSYGGELRLHFGTSVPYENARLAGRTRGEWVLGLRATPWVLAANGAILSRSHDEQQHALRHFEEIEGKPTAEARLRHSDVAVTLRFGDHCWFIALTEPRRRATKSLSLWELLTPGDVVVTAHSDRRLTIEAGSAEFSGDGEISG